MLKIVAESTLGQLFQFVGAVALGVITKVIGDLILSWIRLLGPGSRMRHQILLWIAAVLVALAGAVLFANIYHGPVPAAYLEITSPKDGEVVDLEATDQSGNSGTYEIRGHSRNVSSASDLRICVLAHSAAPLFIGWWPQPAVTLFPQGDWEGIAAAGGSTIAARPGQEYDLVAVAAKSSRIERIDQTKSLSDIRELEPVALSKRIHITVGRIKYKGSALDSWK